MRPLQLNRLPLAPAVSFRANESQSSKNPYSAEAELEKSASKKLWGGLTNTEYLNFCNRVEEKMLAVKPHQSQVLIGDLSGASHPGISQVVVSQDAWQRLVIEDHGSNGGVFVLDPVLPFFRQLKPNERAVLYPNQWIGFSEQGPYIKLFPHWFPKIPVIKGQNLDIRCALFATRLSQASLDYQLPTLPTGGTLKDDRIIFKRILIEAPNRSALMMAPLIKGCLLNNSEIEPGMVHLLRPDDKIRLPGMLPMEVKKSWLGISSGAVIQSVFPAASPKTPKMIVSVSVFALREPTPQLVQAYLDLLSQPGSSLPTYFQWAREVLGVPQSDQKNLAAIRDAYQDLSERFSVYTEDLAKRFTPDEFYQLQLLLKSAREILEAGATVSTQ